MRMTGEWFLAISVNLNFIYNLKNSEQNVIDQYVDFGLINYSRQMGGMTLNFISQTHVTCRLVQSINLL
jgi:hypothetical protein